MDQTTTQNTPPNLSKGQNKLLLITLGLLLFGLGLLAGFLLRGMYQTPTLTQVMPTPTITPAITMQPSPTASTSVTPAITSVPADWLTYKNTTYGFEISYPKTYKALTDKDNLYGWPNAVVLLYNGGQSYDIPIEVWDSKAAYEAKYSTQINNLVVKQVGNKYITILNGTTEPDNAAIIATFKLTN